MKINFVTSQKSWFNSFHGLLRSELELLQIHEAQFLNDHSDIQEGSDLSFFLSYFNIVPKEILLRSKNNLVVHESDLPNGKGWSPLSWSILEGKDEVSVCLIEASEHFDSGVVYLKDKISFSGYELIDEIREKQAKKTIKLCMDFIKNYPNILSEAKKQEGKESFYPRRTAKDSELRIDKSIEEQFNLLRIVDNEDYPAFFLKGGCKYLLKIYKFD